MLNNYNQRILSVFSHFWGPIKDGVASLQNGNKGFVKFSAKNLINEHFPHLHARQRNQGLIYSHSLQLIFASIHELPQGCQTSDD